jgi:cytochrome c
MFKSIRVLLLIILATTSSYTYADKYSNVGRTATEQEIAAWDIDVRPDFKGLPAGSGSVSMGQQIWESRCASCHGTFGESNEVFTPIVGGVTKEDVISGQVAALRSNKQPQKTTIMKVATLSTLWDYIHRAMPWTSPKSLSNDEVFAVVAYILNLSEIIPEDFTLSDKNIADVQKLIPNRNGMTLDHGMWDINGKPDIKSIACMKDCVSHPKITSSLPDLARNAHGNIQQQNRTFGAVRGVDTSKPAITSTNNSHTKHEQSVMNQAVVETGMNTGSQVKLDVLDIAKKSNCLSCHGINTKIIGPAFSDISVKYKSDPNAEKRLVEKVRNGGSGSWGAIAMPAQVQVTNEDIRLLVNWVLNEVR